MNKNIIKFIATATLTVLPTVVLATPTSISVPPSVGGSASSAALSVGGSSSSAALSTGGSSSSASLSTGGSASSAALSTGGSASSATPSTGDSSSSAGPATSPAASGGSSGRSSSDTSGSSGSSFSSGRRSRISFDCPAAITTYMSLGEANNSAEVTKLQSFLKSREGLDIDVNGIFDAKTEAAVKMFQNKYSETIMAPWGVTVPTGRVYITTLKKVNQLACNQPLVLNASELDIINSYRNGAKVSGNNQTSAVVTMNTNGNTSAASTSNGSANGPSDQNVVGSENSGNVASVAKTSILGRFWNFIVSLFK